MPRLVLGFLIGSLCLLDTVVSAQPNVPLYEILPAQTPWPQPIANKPIMGDIRAVINATVASVSVQTQIWWRRNDANPELKALTLLYLNAYLMNLSCKWALGSPAPPCP